MLSLHKETKDIEDILKQSLLDMGNNILKGILNFQSLVKRDLPKRDLSKRDQSEFDVLVNGALGTLYVSSYNLLRYGNHLRQIQQENSNACFFENKELYTAKVKYQEFLIDELNEPGEVWAHLSNEKNTAGNNLIFYIFIIYMNDLSDEENKSLCDLIPEKIPQPLKIPSKLNRFDAISYLHHLYHSHKFNETKLEANDIAALPWGLIKALSISKLPDEDPQKIKLVEQLVTLPLELDASVPLFSAHLIRYSLMKSFVEKTKNTEILKKLAKAKYFPENAGNTANFLFNNIFTLHKSLSALIYYFCILNEDNSILKKDYDFIAYQYICMAFDNPKLMYSVETISGLISCFDYYIKGNYISKISSERQIELYQKITKIITKLPTSEDIISGYLAHLLNNKNKNKITLKYFLIALMSCCEDSKKEKYKIILDKLEAQVPKVKEITYQYRPDPLVKEMGKQLFEGIFSFSNVVISLREIKPLFFSRETILPVSLSSGEKKLDERDRLLADFYESFFQLIKTGYEIRLYSEGPVSISALVEIYNKLCTDLYAHHIKNLFGRNKEVGKYLCNNDNKEACFIMHHLVFVTHATMADESQFLLDNLLAESIGQRILVDTSSQDIVTVLEYIKHIEKQNLPDEKDNSSNDFSSISNTLIRMDCILSIPGMPPEKIAQLKKFASTPLKFDASIPSIYIQYLQNKMMETFFIHIEITDILPQSIKWVKLIFGEHRMVESSGNTSDVSRVHCNLLSIQNILDIFRFHYGINDKKNRFNMEAAFFNYHYLCFVNHHRDSFLVSGELQLSKKAVKVLIMDGRIAFLKNNEQRKVCIMIISLLHRSMNNPRDMEEFEDFKEKIDNYALALLMQSCEDSLKHLFSCLLPFLSKQNAKKYKAVGLACEFYFDLFNVCDDNSFSNEKNRNNFKILLENIKKGKYSFAETPNIFGGDDDTLQDLKQLLHNRFMFAIQDLQKEMDIHNFTFKDEAERKIFKDTLVRLAVILGAKKEKFESGLQFKLASKPSKASAQNKPKEKKETPVEVEVEVEVQDQVVPSEQPVNVVDETIAHPLPEVKSDVPSFKPSPILLKLQSHIDRCLDVLDSQVKEQTFKDIVPGIIAKTDMDSFSGECDGQSQKIVDFYKVIFKLIRKEYANFNEFEALQKEAHDRLLIIKNEDKLAWDYLVNNKMNKTGIRCICLLFQLKRIVYKNSSVDASLFDACEIHIVSDYYKTVLDPSFDEMKNESIVENNYLVRAEFILSGSLPINEKVAQLIGSPFLLSADIPLDTAYFIKNHYAVLFFLSVPHDQNCFSTAKTAAFKLTKAGYFIDHDKSSGTADKHLFYYILQTTKNLKTYQHQYSIENKNEPESHFKKLIYDLSMKSVFLFNYCNTSDPLLTGVIASELKKNIDFILESHELNCPDDEIDQFFRCAIKIIVTANPVPAKYIKDINKILSELFLNNKKLFEALLEVLCDHTAIKSHNNKFRALVSAYEFFEDLSFENDNQFRLYIKTMKQHDFNELTQYFSHGGTQSFRTEFKTVFLNKIENLKSSINLEDIALTEADTFIIFQKQVLDLTEKLGADASEIALLESTLFYNKNRAISTAQPVKKNPKISDRRLRKRAQHNERNDAGAAGKDLNNDSLSDSVSRNLTPVSDDISNEHSGNDNSNGETVSASEKPEVLSENGDSVSTSRNLTPVSDDISNEHSGNDNSNGETASASEKPEVLIEHCDSVSTGITENDEEITTPAQSEEGLESTDKIAKVAPELPTVPDEKKEIEVQKPSSFLPTFQSFLSQPPLVIQEGEDKSESEELKKKVTITRDDLKKLKMTSILRFSEEIFDFTGFPLVVTGGALLYLLLREENPFDCDVGAFSKYDTLSVFLDQSYKVKKAGIRSVHPILKMKLLQGKVFMDLDISCYDINNTDTVEKVMMQNMLKRDWKSCAFFMIVHPEALSFEIQGPPGFIKSVLDGYNGYVSRDVIINDLSCLWRLAKLRLKHPWLKKNDNDTDCLLAEIKFTGSTLFKKFIYENSKLPLIGNRIEELFRKFPADQVLLEFYELPIMLCMSIWVKKEIILETAPVLQGYFQSIEHMKSFSENFKKGFYYFIYAHLCCNNMENEEDIARLFTEIESTLERDFEAPDFKANLDYIKGNSANNRSVEKNFHPKFIDLIAKIKAAYPDCPAQESKKSNNLSEDNVSLGEETEQPSVGEQVSMHARTPSPLSTAALPNKQKSRSVGPFSMPVHLAPSRNEGEVFFNTHQRKQMHPPQNIPSKPSYPPSFPVAGNAMPNNYQPSFWPQPKSEQRPLASPSQHQWNPNNRQPAPARQQFPLIQAGTKPRNHTG